MIKNLVLAAALLSLAFAVGCATGGNGIPPVVPSVSVTASTSPLYPTQTVTLTAATTDPTYAPVTWSVTGGGSIVSNAPPDAATMTSATAVYMAPATAGSTPIVTAALVSNPAINNPLGLPVVDITTQVAPATLSVGENLTQQFTAVAVPDAAPQTFQWTCTANNVQCPGSAFSQDPNISGLAYYTGQSNCIGCTIAISAVTPLDTTGCVANPKYCIAAKATVVTSRVSGTYAFQFSGYDTDGNAVAVAGTFTAGTNGAITTGVEDLLNSGVWAKKSITGGSYTPTSADPNNGNNAGTLKLTLPANVYPNQFQVVLDGNGDLEMIESDGHGSGSGIAQVSAGSGPFNGAQVYAFGFTGVDSGGKRVGYAGVLPMDGAGNIVSGQIDVNDNGSSSNSVCSTTPPCSVAGTYSANGDGSWNVALTSPVAMSFDFYIAGGSSNGKTNPLTFYAISTDPPANPAVSGTMVLQDNTQIYNIAAFDGTSVSALTGAGTGTNGAIIPQTANVSLTLGQTNGSGIFEGNFDQNNAGVILSGTEFTTYTYTASSTVSGRYTFQMLGDPAAKTVVPPVPFILYASGQNRGFLLDQSSLSVMTGTMIPQGKIGVGGMSGSELPGTFAATTTSSANSSVTPTAANLLFTSTGFNSMDEGTFNVTGTQYPGPVAVAENYTLGLGPTGTIVPISGGTGATYAIYVVGTLACNGTPNNPNPACAVTSFMMIDEDTTNMVPSVIFARE
jgi:hypothetical protein